jgi:glycine betaine catabolism A
MFNQDSLPGSLDREGLEACLRPFGESRMLPRAAYTDPEVFAWEHRGIFGSGWTCVGRSDDLAEAGDQRAEAVGDGSVLIVRDTDGTLHGLVNTCRHRGHELRPCGSSGNNLVLQCPYHSWTYGLDGGLKVTPGFTRAPDFDVRDFGLAVLPTEEWHGWVFVDSGDSGPLADHLCGLDELVEPYAPARLRVAARHEYEIASNWKTIIENYQECYHCPRIHPELCVVSPPESGGNYALSGEWAGGWMELREGVDTMSLDGHSGGVMLAGLDQKLRRQVLYLVVFPNLLVSLHPDYVMTHRMRPLAADRTWVECTWAFPPEATERDGFDPAYAVDFWDITNRQDWLACESVQRGLTHPRAVPGPLSQDEEGVYHFVSMVAGKYLGRSA